MNRLVRNTVLATLCLVVLPVVLVAGSAAWAARATLLDPEYHDTVMEKTGVYAGISRLLADSVARALTQGAEMKSPLAEQIGEGLRAAAMEVVPPDWVRREVSRIASQSLTYLEGSGPLPVLAVDLSEPKERVAAFLEKVNMPAAIALLVRNSISSMPSQFWPATIDTERVFMVLSLLRPEVRGVVLAAPASVAALGVITLLAWAVSGRRVTVWPWFGGGLFGAGLLSTGLAIVGRSLVLDAAAGLEVPPDLRGLPLREWMSHSCAGFFAVWQSIGMYIAVAGAVMLLLPWAISLLRAARAGARPPG